MEALFCSGHFQQITAEPKHLTTVTEMIAYVGPGLGAGAIAAVIGILAGFFLLVLGFLWYPFKKLIRWIRSRK